MVIHLSLFSATTKGTDIIPKDFTELSVALKSVKDDDTITSLVDILGSLEKKVPCFFLPDITIKYLRQSWHKEQPSFITNLAHLQKHQCAFSFGRIFALFL